MPFYFEPKGWIPLEKLFFCSVSNSRQHTNVSLNNKFIGSSSLSAEINKIKSQKYNTFDKIRKKLASGDHKSLIRLTWSVNNPHSLGFPEYVGM